MPKPMHKHDVESQANLPLTQDLLGSAPAPPPLPREDDFSAVSTGGFSSFLNESLTFPVSSTPFDDKTEKAKFQ